MLFIDVHRDSRWNPWVLDERQAELEQAMHVMDQWRRAEPGHRMLTTRQLEARWARQDRQRERAVANLKKERDARKALYDEERASARLALFEHQSRLEHEVSELAGYLDGSRSPGMDPARRQEEIAALEESIERRRLEIERLALFVGDPETVVDQNGWLPKDRREYMLFYYRLDREQTVKQLRVEIPELATSAERKDRIKADLKRRRLDELLAVPPLSADDMCSDCPTPIAKHGWRTPPFDGPCPAWPGWGARLRQAREMLARAQPATRRNQQCRQPQSLNR
ncbi:hypothetical protein [Mycolicibacterium agri]|nr:hypothetical protein [Mycolicibacterium agri]